MGKVRKNIYSINGQSILSVFCCKIFLVVVFFALSKISAQSVSGFVYKENREVLSGAIVSLLDPENDDIIEYQLTDEKGYYTIQNIKNGNYKININAIGFHKIEQKVNINGNLKSDYNLISEKEQKIEEVIITASKPIKIKSDTIEMIAKSFMDGTEKNVEDLLKNLPGVTVESDGKIKIGGREIEKVMVENDDFFERGYTMLTKNMSVKPIEKVQILENYSNNKLLKGVENSDKVAINLTLSDDAKRDWFGNADVFSSFFPESFYSGKLNLTKFGKRAKYFLLGSTNTIGKNTIGDIDHLIKPSIQDEAGFINIDTEAYKFGADSFVYLPFGSEKAKFNNDKLVSANAIFNLNNKMKLKIVSLGNFEKSNFNKTSTTDYNLGDTQFTNIEEFSRQSKKTNYFNKLDFEYDISKKMTLKYSGNINYWTNNKYENQNLNGLAWSVAQNTNNHSIDNHLLLTNKINEKFVWLNGLRYFNQSVKDHNFSDQFFFDELFPEYETISNFNQNSKSKVQFLGVISQLLYRTEKENLWDFSFYNYNTIQNFSNIMGFEKNSISYFFPKDFKNDFSNVNNDFVVSLKQTSTFEKFKIKPQLDVHYVKNGFDNKYRKIKNEDFFYLIPNLNVSWAVHNKGKLNASIFLSRNNTEIVDMLPNYFSDSPRSLIRGLNNFEYLKNSGGTIKYTYGNFTDRVFINLFGSYTKYHNYLSYNYSINQEYTVSNLLFLKNREDYLLAGELDYYIKPIRSNFKILYTVSTSQYEDQIENGNFRNVTSSYNRIGFQLKSAWKKVIDYRIGTNLNVSKIKTDQQNSKVLSQEAFFDLLLTLSKKTNLELKNKYYSFDGYFNKENSYNFLDFKLSYQYDKNISFSLLGNNLFNVKKYREVSITSYSNYVSEYSIFPRYLMLEINFGL